MGRSFRRLLILLAAYIMYTGPCAGELMDYERDACDARVVVGDKYYTVVDDAEVTFDQAASTCAKTDGPGTPCFPTVVLDTGSRPYDAPFQLLGAGDFSTYGSIVDLDCPGDYNITYRWKVREEENRRDPDVPPELTMIGIYENGRVDNNSPVKATSGTFILRAEYPQATERVWLPYEQELTLIPPGYPTCMISCSREDNCNYLATKSHERLRLWTECWARYNRWFKEEGLRPNLALMGPEHSFYWSLKQFPEGFGGIDWGNDTLTGREQDELIVKDHIFTVPGEYILRLDILTNGVLCTAGNCSYTEWKFFIQGPPANAREPVCAADVPVPLSSVECNRTQPYSELDTSWTGEGCECREVSNLCTLSPTEGIALTTRFDLGCLDFEGVGAIRYEFYYRTRATASVSTLADSDSAGHYNLLQHGMSPKPLPFKLPSGLASDDYKVFILVEMSDQEGTTKTSELELTVRLPPFEELLTAIDTTNAEVETAIRWGNKMEAVHLSTIIAATLNNIRSEGAYGVVDWREARQAIIYNVGRVPIENVETVIQSSESLIQATHYDDEVTADGQVSAAKQLLHMAKFMTQKVTTTNMTQEKVERVAGIIMTAAFNVFKSSEVVAGWKHTGSGPPEDANTTESTLLKNRNATTVAFRAIDELTNQILMAKGPREVVTMISSEDFQVVINRTDCPTWFNNKDHTVHFTSFEEGTWFRLPPLPVFVMAYARSVLVLHSRWRNPFEYATNISHRDLGIGIGGLHFSDSMERKWISGLEEPIEFSILRHNQSVAAEEFDDVVVGGAIQYVPFKYNGSIDPEDTFIFLAPKDPLVSPSFTLYLAYGIKPNATLFDLTTTLPIPSNMSYSLDLDENITVTSDPYIWRMRLGDVDIWDSNDTHWYIGIVPTSAEGTDSGGGLTVSFAVFVEPVECVFFNEKDHFWDRSGCEVGPLTSRTHLHCRCDHLTKFSGLMGLIPPNEINFERALEGFLLLKNLIQNPIGIMTCCVLFSFYIALCVPWTRKNDAKDLGKITTAAIFDDTRHPKPRYYLRVFTGPRSNAGTTAKVSIMLHGATRECGPFLLHQPYSAMFEKGNMAGFVLCTETDPGWLTHVRVWHDNSGKEPSWFLEKVFVEDLQRKVRYFFLCSRWLAFDEDDEQIERVLPAAKDEQLVAFSTLFADRTAKDLRDGHIWYSVYGRPASSPFTRTQRVSCCLSIIMCTMLANIMFFGRGDDFAQPEPVRIFGFDVQIPISWPQIVIGLQSAAVVFPINAIIIWIFRSVKQRPENAQKKSMLNFATVHHIPYTSTSADNRAVKEDKSDGRPKRSSSKNKPASTGLSSTEIYLMNVEPSLPEQVRKEAAHTRQDKVTEPTSLGQSKSQEVNEKYAVLDDPEKDTPGVLPWWFVYIGFILVFVTTNTAAFFVMLYTFEFGREKAEAWLLIFLASFLSDLILIQPVKILAMAALFAVFFKKADKGDEGKKLDLKQCEDIAKDQKKGPPAPDLQASPDLAQARMVAVRRRKLRTILKEVAVYALFLAVVMLAAYGQKNHMAFYMSNELQRLVVHNEEMSFEEVSDADSYWTWLEDAAIPGLYPDASSAVLDLPAYRVGPIRLRQARVKLHPDCLTTVSPGNQTSECDRRYDYFSQDEGRYGEGWLPLPTVNITAFNGTNGTAEIADRNGTSPWEFRSSEDLHATRAVFTDVTLYSPDSNLFSIVTLLVEFTAVGAGFPRWEVHTVRLYRFHGGWEVWMSLVYISALAIFTLVFAIKEVRKAYNSGALYIMDFWNWVELIIILQAVTGVATYFYSEAVLEDVASKREDNTAASGHFVNYRRAAVWDQVYTYVIATLLCSVTLKMTHLLRFNHRASLLIHTLKRSVGPLSGFSIMFFLYFFAFAILLHLTFGLRILAYSSFARTFEAMVTIIAGDLNFQQISTTTGNLGTFILFLFVFVFNICLIGFFVAIIDESYHSAKDDEQLEKTDYDLKGFFKYHLQKLKPKKKERQDYTENTSISGPGYDELKVNVMKRLRTVFEDLDER
ncbi:PKDREJ [Branchiostoma lanceolatum]|uniref:PKDREJ protein n=1 Tax=Branchiostoma lanceolatum TaxID=7740 RepID=A0A8K0E7N2_BRALA|nr:PKDREJ [Branchiostoma lanceolatum]